MKPAGWPLRLRDYAREALGADLLAACVVSVLLIPQSLAYAMLAGLPPSTGMVASLLPLLLYAWLGSSPYLGVGPVAVLALMISQTLAQAPAGFGAGEAALVLAAEVGLLLAAAAVLRLDALAALLSVPVLQGFEAGATLSIALSQLPLLLGSSVSGSSLPQLWRVAQSGQLGWQLWGAGFGLVALLILGWGRRGLQALLRRWLPEARVGVLMRLLPLLVLLLAMALAMGLDAGQRGVQLVGPLPHLHLALALPPLAPALWLALLPGAAMLALMAYVTSLVVSESLARRRGERIDARRELMGLAGANLAAALSLGMPVAASFSRSVLLFDAGSRTRMSGVFIALLMGLAMWLLAPALAWLPTSVLAASILVAVLAGLKLQPFVEAWRYARPEALLMLAVAATVLVLGVSPALGLGVLGSIALLLQRTATPHVAVVGRVPGTEHYRNLGRYQVECQPGVLGLRIDESLLFTNARGLADVVLASLAERPDVERVVLQMSPVNAIDFSGLEALRDLQEALQRQGLRLDVSEVKGPVLDRLQAADWQRWFRGRVYLSHHQGMLDGSHEAADWASP